MDVTVIIVTCNSAECVPAAVRAAQAQSGVTLEIVVVDNASHDGTAAALGLLPGPLQIIENPANVGFGRANNQGFAVSCGRYIYLLNPDAELTGPGDLARLVHAMDGHPQWGMAGSGILSPAGKPESLPALEYPDQRHVRRDFSTLPGRIAWVIGASMIVRRDVYAALGGFDPDFFLYSEETDFCLRLREAGHEIGFVGEVVVRHVGGASERQSDPYDQWRRRMRGLHRFWEKHYAAADVVRLVKRDRLRAGWRAFLNGGLAAVLPAGSRAGQKQRRYRAIRDASDEFLASKQGWR